MTEFFMEDAGTLRDDYHRRVLLDEIERTIRLAEIRCIPFEELLKRIERLWEDELAGELVYRACEESCSHDQLFALAQSVRNLSKAVENLPSRSKASVDRAIRRILSRMPAEIAAPIAEPWLEHKRKFRREIAYAHGSKDACIEQQLLHAISETRFVSHEYFSNDEKHSFHFGREPGGIIPAVAAIGRAIKKRAGI